MRFILVAIATMLVATALACGAGSSEREGTIGRIPPPRTGPVAEGRLLLLSDDGGDGTALAADIRKTDLAAKADYVVASPNGRLLATTYRAGPNEPTVFAVRTADGRERFRLTDDVPYGHLDSWDFAWSPQGDELAVRVPTGSPKDAFDISVMRADGSERRLLRAERAGVDSYRIIGWAADGERLLALGCHRPVPYICIDSRLLSIDTSTGASQILHTPRNGPQGPGGAVYFDGNTYLLSPDRRHIAYYTRQATNRGDFELWVMDADGAKARLLTTWQNDAFVQAERTYVTAALPRTGLSLPPDTLLKAAPPVVSWSPDSRRIAFNVRGELHIVSLRGGDLKVADNVSREFAWSPDGRMLAATATAVGRVPELMLATVDGKCQSLHPFIGRDGDTINVGAGAQHPVWSPGGDYLAFASRGSIYTVRRDGSDVRQLPNTRGLAPAAWLPE